MSDLVEITNNGKIFFLGYTVGTETVNYIVINDLKIRATEKLLFIAQSLSNQIKIEVIMKCSNKINFPMKPFYSSFSLIKGFVLL